MNKSILSLLIFGLSIVSFGQNTDTDLKITSIHQLDEYDIQNIFGFQGIKYQKLKFIGNDFKNKTYKITAKEFLDGNIVTDTLVFDSAEMYYDELKKVKDTILEITVLAKQIDNTTLKMEFIFPRFSLPREYKVLDLKNKYSLRNIASESKLDIRYNEKFYLLAYIQPYDRKDGTLSYCDVGLSGMDIENWVKKFDIKHYWTFEMEFK
ncbi:hypothetical protein [Snuella sedimenti]|uniref:Uncharacterized protein n=1 Tax=Snuella sedimenti TaxID=2798802 RepID=A0A8J7ILG0_9FLAO|nr:hypothetical protein [Snuella sedimenti]MBJ6366537.1 hypothetical protein [Snuella sedimenti]